jgi:hypothetical protein
MPGNHRLKITLTQEEDGAVVSELTLDYPSLENATANVLSMDLVQAVSGVAEKWSAAKAAMIGEEELFEMAQTIRKSQMKKGKEESPAQEVGRGILR